MIILQKDMGKHLWATAYRHAYYKLYKFSPHLSPRIKRPHVVEVELSNICNLDCIQCHRKKMKKEYGYLDAGTFLKLVDELHSYPVAFLRLIGRGEPSLNPEFRTCMEALSGKRIKVELCTNGHLFKQFSPDEILGWNIDLLDISVDGFDEHSYNRIRVNGNYQELRSHIQHFYTRRNEMKRRSPKVRIRNVLFPEFTESEVEQFKTDWSASSDLITFNVLNPLESINGSVKNGFHCKGVFFDAHVRWDGKVPICGEQFIYREEEYLGDLRQQELQEIWRSSTLRKLRGSHRKKDFDTMPECGSCFCANVPNKHNSKIIIPK